MKTCLTVDQGKRVREAINLEESRARKEGRWAAVGAARRVAAVKSMAGGDSPPIVSVGCSGADTTLDVAWIARP